jgi:hypothetical protein
VHAYNKLHSVDITNAAESILGEGVARPTGAHVRAHGVDTLIFTEMWIFWTFIDVYAGRWEERDELAHANVMHSTYLCKSFRQSSTYTQACIGRYKSQQYWDKVVGSC